jgi:hypothetical protein
MSHDTTPDWLKPARAELARLHPGAAQDAALLARLTEQQHLLRVRRQVDRQPRPTSPAGCAAWPGAAAPWARRPPCC